MMFCENTNPLIRNASLLLALIAWALTIALVYNLLDGTFEAGRTCQTDCVQMLYAAAALVALLGVAFSFVTRKRGGCIGLIASGLLLVIFATTMFIGTFL